MYKLVRDNIPEILKEKNETEMNAMPVDYAQICNGEFYIKMLNAKLVEECNEYLASLDDLTKDSVEELVDVLTVIKALATVKLGSGERLEELYEKKLKEKGGFEKRYIMFFPDQMPVVNREEGTDATN